MKTRGFTLVELVMVMIVVGVLAVFAMPRMADRLTFSSVAYYDQAKAMLRYAQKLAVAQNRPVYVRLNGSSIALCYDAACSSRVAPPAGRSAGTATCASDPIWFCEVPPSGVTYSSPNALFYYSAQGKPFNPTDSASSSTFNNQLAVTFTISGDSTPRVIYVERETGYVHS